MSSDAGDAEDDLERTTASGRRRDPAPETDSGDSADSDNSAGSADDAEDADEDDDADDDAEDDVTMRRPRPPRPFDDTIRGRHSVGARRSGPPLPPETTRQASSPARLLHPQYPARPIREVPGRDHPPAPPAQTQSVVDGEAVDRAIRAKAVRRAAALGALIVGGVVVAAILLVMFLVLPA